jgi:NAD(P)-dependent dehydrogenase (short-subunit alcohol dehydrogenase family)
MTDGAQGCLAVITGAPSGIGRACLAALGRRPANELITQIRGEYSDAIAATHALLARDQVVLQ